jgi:hypothetical protein
MVAALSVVEQMAELVEELRSAKGQYICAFYGRTSCLDADLVLAKMP